MNLLIHLLDDPAADLLVLTGLIILAVAIIGNLSDQTDRARRLLVSLIGCLFVALGFLVHSNHELTATADAANSAIAHEARIAALDPASLTFSSSAVDKYLGKPLDPPAYFGQMRVTPTTFLGTWTNLGDAGQSGIHKIRIVSDGAHLLVHVWGLCKPVDCDWGEQPASLNDETARLTFDTANPVRQFALVPMPSGELQVEMMKATSKKPTHNSASVFAKSN